MIELIAEMTLSKNEYEKNKLIYENMEYKTEFTKDEIRKIKELIKF